VKYNYRVKKISDLSKGNYIISLDKGNLKFKAGQFFSLGISQTFINREYSVCSGENDETLDFLIREVEGGILSKKLRELKIDDEVKVLGPYGSFYLDQIDLKRKYIFIATGTGISPFMSLLKTYPEINYQLFHGIRFEEDVISHLSEKNYFKFISKEKINKQNYFYGRISKNFDMIKDQDKNSFVFLCGNSLMVTEIYDKLINNNFKSENIFTEIFF
tara:strand:+ start:234 stop:884 length:651 start_codon:yes stop_codon:yes gene_type:complete